MTRKCHLSRYIHWAYLLGFLLFKIIGLATFSVQRNNSTRRSLETSCAFIGTKLAILYNLLLFCMAVSVFTTIPSRYYSDYTNKNMITTIVEIFLGILGTLMICTVLLCYCKDQSTLVRIGNHFILVETELRRLREPIDRKRTVCLLLVLYLFQLGLVVAVMVTDYLAFQSTPMLWLTDIMPIAFASWILIQYFSVLTFVNATFADVNGSIQSLCRSCSYCKRPMLFNQYRRVVVTSSSIQLLLRFRDIHDHLCSISDDISEFYSIPVLVGVSYVFFQFLYNVYYLLIPIVMNDIVLDPMILANTILLLVILVYPLSLLTTKITNTAKEVGASGHRAARARERGNLSEFSYFSLQIGKTRVSVHALLNCAIDGETKAELLQRKIKFTANGYFVLDNTLLQTMLGAVTTYVVILIQFQMATTVPTVFHCNCTRE
ncbi:putative gustatory receptor 28a isoform X2 [Andrena cerasifolii]|uniref:putative gustatory receptor 28a isoform X2 n=1 Tax=Andrena cerasifolii TaxID=2819439 RepID=UPI004037CF12